MAKLSNVPPRQEPCTLPARIVVTDVRAWLAKDAEQASSVFCPVWTACTGATANMLDETGQVVSACEVDAADRDLEVRNRHKLAVPKALACTLRTAAGHLHVNVYG